MANLAALEQLVTAQTAHFYAEGTATEARMESRLFGAAVEAGMDREHDDLHGWVAETVGAFLTSGPSIDDADLDDYGLTQDDFGRWEYAA